MDKVAPALPIGSPRLIPRHGRQVRSADDRGMDEVKDAVLRMGSLVEAQILAAINAVVHHDAAAALRVIGDDRQDNDVHRTVTAMVAGVIASRNLVAHDLRFLLTLDHVSYELERMGDHAGSVARQARKLAPYPPLRNSVLMPELGHRVAVMVAGIIRALVDMDQGLARHVAALDDEVDELYHQVFDITLDLMRDDPANVGPGTRILFASHSLERIGDRVTNIAEDIVFLVSGEIEDLNP